MFDFHDHVELNIRTIYHFENEIKFTVIRMLTIGQVIYQTGKL